MSRGTGDDPLYRRNILLGFKYLVGELLVHLITVNYLYGKR